MYSRKLRGTLIFSLFILYYAHVRHCKTFLALALENLCETL